MGARGAALACGNGDRISATAIARRCVPGPAARSWRDRRAQKGDRAMAETVRMTAEEVHGLIRRVLTANGFDAANTEAIAANMGGAECSGAASHGLFRLPGHVRAVAAGKASGQARPAVSRPAPGIVRVDGDRGFTPISHRAGLAPLAEAAREQGVAVLAIARTLHFAALWPEVETLAAGGLCAIAMTSSPPYVAQPGGTQRVFGTNPLAFGWPRQGHPPMVWDMATAAMARGEISLAKRDGHGVPEGTGIDADGRPTTDPAAILEGAQLPFGGVKGGLLALMVDLMAGPLIGELTSLEAGAEDPLPGLTEVSGEIVVAFDPARLGARFDGAEALFAAIAGQEGARLPGDRRTAARARIAAEGVAVPAALHAEISALAPGG